MMLTARLVATCLGIGFIRKGAGTVAAMVFCLVFWLTAPVSGAGNLYILLVAFLFLAGLWSAGVVEKDWGKDSNRVVVDEMLGMSVSLLFIPLNWKYLAAAFILFRFFDIAKPLFIRRAEKMPAGWGVMMDDLLAGIYANFILQLLIWTGFK